MINFYNNWGYIDSEFQLFSLFYHNRFYSYKELVIIIFNFQISITFKKEK